MRKTLALPIAAWLWLALNPATAQDSVGQFESHADVGAVLHPGSVQYDAARGVYTVTGSGENMWFTTDGFHFAWTKMSGDVTLTADIAFPTTGGDAHKKGVLMIRQSLDADSAYADAALHGNGLTSLQSREAKGVATHEIESNISGPTRLRLEKRGNRFYLLVARAGQDFQRAGGSMTVSLQEPFYVGVGVCSHNKDISETATFSKVELQASATAPGGKPALYSTLETINVGSTDRRVVYVTPGRLEAPNWTHDGASLLFNRDGKMERITVEGGTPLVINTGFAVHCNNDHGLSPDGALLAISDRSPEDQRSVIYIVPVGGGVPRRVTKNAPSYWHGWSPDGQTLAFCGQRHGKFDIYTIPAAGGEETRLTTATGLNDGPEYSPDGKYIYFNSERTGSMQIWRMLADGSEQEQVTSDDSNNWFPHLSPDGRRMVFLSYEKGVTGHPANQPVMLRLMTLADKKITVLTKLFGGQGTINVPSWSPDSKRLAFVSYQLIP